MVEHYPQTNRKAALAASARSQAGILFPALAASAVYTFAFSALTNQLGNVGQLVTLALLFVAPFEIILVLWNAGIRPPLVLFGGILGLIFACMGIVCVLCFPVLVIMAVQALATAIHGAIPAIPEWAVGILFEFFPAAQLAFIVVQLVRSALTPGVEA